MNGFIKTVETGGVGLKKLVKGGEGKKPVKNHPGEIAKEQEDHDPVDDNQGPQALLFFFFRSV
jgi:hypothetical protein